MASPHVQSSSGSVGNSGSGSISFTNPQMAGGTNVIFVNSIGGSTTAGTITGVTDSAGNTYAQRAYAASTGNGQPAGVWIYSAEGIAAHGAGNAVQATWTGGNFVDLLVVQYPKTGAFIIGGGAGRFGGGTVVPNSPLSGVPAGSLVVCGGTTGNTAFTTPGSIGSHAANLVAVSGGGDKWLFEDDGSADGSNPLNCTIGTAVDDYFAIVSAAWAAVVSAAPSNVILFGTNF